MKYKLGPNCSGFTDLYSGITLLKGEVKDFPVLTHRIRLAVKGKGLIPVPDELLPDVTQEPELTVEPGVTQEPDELDPLKDPLYQMTTKAILKRYDYLSDEELKLAKEQPSKSKLIRFLRSLEKT